MLKKAEDEPYVNVRKLKQPLTKKKLTAVDKIADVVLT